MGLQSVNGYLWTGPKFPTSFEPSCLSHLQMIAFMVLNIICFVVDGIAAVLLFLILGIWIAVASEIQNNCTTLAKGNCRCMYKGKAHYYKGRFVGVFARALRNPLKF